MSKERGLKGVILTLMMAIIAIAIVYRLTNGGGKSIAEEEAVAVTEVEKVLMRNMDTNYPQTPKEVVKYFAEITKCYYNETFESDEDLETLADRMLLLYDDELVSYNDHSNYMFDLKNEIKFYNENNYRLSNFKPSASTDVEFFTQDGYEWARLWCIFTLKSGKYYKDINEVFILRKDEVGHWKIYGWKEVDEG